MMVLVLAGLALALSSQGAAARGGSGGGTIIVNSDGWSGHRATRHSHRHGDRWQRLSRPALKNPAIRAFHRSAINRFGAHSFSGHGSDRSPHHGKVANRPHKPSDSVDVGHASVGPRIIVIEPSGSRHSAAPNVVVLRGGSPAVTVLGGGNVVVLSTSPGFKHIVIGK